LLIGSITSARTVVYLSDERVGRTELARCCCSDSRVSSDAVAAAEAVARPRLRAARDGDEWLFSVRALLSASADCDIRAYIGNSSCFSAQRRPPLQRLPV